MKERISKKVGGQIWTMVVAPAVVVVIGAFATAYFNGCFEKSTSPPTPPQAVTTFDGMIYSDTGPVAKAMVELDLSGSAGANGPTHFYTDATGRYRFDVPAALSGTVARLSVKAAGYKQAGPAKVALPLQADNRMDFPLTAEPAPVASTGGGGGSAAPPHPPLQIHPGIAHLPAYVPLTAAQAVRVRIAQKK
jgi:hypothetical protein